MDGLHPADELVTAVPIALTAAAPGSVAVTASLRSGVAGNANAATSTANVRYAVPANPLLVQPLVPGADFVRTNGAEHPLERDRLAFWVGSRTYALTHADFEARTPDGPPVISIAAPEGAFITSFQSCNSWMFYSGGASKITPADGNVCTPAPASLVNSGSASWDFSPSPYFLGSTFHFRRRYALGNTFHFSPPATGAGKAEITVTWRLNSGVFSKTLTLRYGPDVPADYPIPYPVAQVSVPTGALSVAYGAPVRYGFRVIDARDGAPISYRDELSAANPVRIDWYDAGDLRREGGFGVNLMMFPDEPDWSLAKRYDRDDLAALLPRSAWDVDLEPVTYPPLGPAGAARGVVMASAPGVRHPSLSPGRTRSLISITSFGDYSYSTVEADGIPAVRASLPADADQILQPGAEEPIRIGLGSSISGKLIPRVGRSRFTVGCIHPRTATAEPNRTWPAAPDPGAPPHDCGWDDIVDGEVSYLRISGPASWRGRDGSDLPIGINADSDPGTADEYPVFACADPDSAGNFICSIRGPDGGLPRIVVAEMDDIIRIRLGVTEDADRKQIIDGIAAFTVGPAPPVETVSLAFADAREAPSLPAGASAELRLRLQVGDGRPAEVSALSSVTVAADRGALLSSPYCAESSSCTLRLASGDGATLAAAAEADPAVTDDIRLTVTAPKTGDRVLLYVSVVSVDGSTSEAKLAIDLVGPVARIEVSGGAAPRDRPDDDERGNHGPLPAGSALFSARVADIRARAAADGDLVLATLKVAAYDERGNRAGLPADARVDGITGPALSSALVAAELACSDAAARLDCAVAVKMGAAAADPLAPGAYIVRVVAAGFAAEDRFFVAGRAARIEIAPGPPPAGIGVVFNLAVRAFDANDQPVADGTAIAVSVRGARRGTAPVLLASPAGGSAPAENGGITVRLVASAPEIGILRVAAGPAAAPDFAAAHVLDLRALGSAGPLAGHLGAAAGAVPWSGYRTWTGPRGSPVSQLLDEIPALASVRLWNGKRWLSYARLPGGAEAPGSIDFLIEPSDLLFLSPSGP